MLNKKALRAFANSNPSPAIPPNHGLLNAQQVNHIVRTDIRIIDRRRTLIIYIYDRKQTASGNPAPVWTMFHAGDDYITLARRPDDTTFWRTAAFDNLGENWTFVSKCAFYSVKDQERVARYFHSDAPGFTPLIHAQYQILNRRQKERQRKRDKAVRDRMKCLPALPRNLATWAHRNVMPAYFVYDRARKGKATGICTSCGHETTHTGIRHNAKGVCPHCGRTLTMKPRSRIGRLCDRETFQVLQQTKTGELVVRIIKARCTYYGERPGTLVNENARQFFRLDPDGHVRCDSYYYSYSESKWKQGDRPVLFPYQYNFEADTCGHVYVKNLPKVLSGTPWKYCPVQQFYEHFRLPMQMYHFLVAYFEHPKLEHLVKVGFYSLASDLAYRNIYGLRLDESQKRTHRVLGVKAEDVDFLRNLDVNYSALQTFWGYCERNLKDRQRLLTWQVEQNVHRNIDPILERMTAHKFMRYLDGQYAFLQYRLTPSKARRYGSMQDLVTEYRDYLELCMKQKYDMKNSFVLFPNDLQKAHDKVVQRIKFKADAKARKAFNKAYQRIMGQLDFEMNGMRIVYPASLDDLVSEGHALHHCVGGYVERVAAQRTLIVFLRRSEDLGKSFYTVEVQNKKVVQVRGMQNAAPTLEVQRFMDVWEQRVLQGRAKAA